MANRQVKPMVELMSNSGDKNSRLIGQMSVPTKKRVKIDFKGIPSGHSFDLRAVLTDEDGNPVPDKTIKIYYSWFDRNILRLFVTAKTDEIGVAVVNVKHYVWFGGDKEYGSSGAGGPFPPYSIFGDPEQVENAKRTKLALDVVYLDGSARLTARLTDEDGNPVSGEEIWFAGMGYWLDHATTDDQGVATVVVSRYTNIGNVEYRWYLAEFDGDYERLYDWSYDEFTILPKTVLTLDTVYKSAKTKAVAKLTDEHGKPLFNKSIDFYLIINDREYKYVDDFDTDDEGTMYMEYEFKVVFEGDDYYEPSEAWAQFVASKPQPSPEPSPSPSGTACPFEKGVICMLSSIVLAAVLLLFAARRKQAWALI